MYFIQVILYGLVYVIISLFQIDTPEAGVQISRAAQSLGFLGIADCSRGLFESDYVAFVVQLSN
jgi:hypothetical protein